MATLEGVREKPKVLFVAPKKRRLGYYVPGMHLYVVVGHLVDRFGPVVQLQTQQKSEKTISVH
mgnify:CR=1 FL=1